MATAKVFGQIRAHLEEAGNLLPDAGLKIAATSIYHDLELVSGNPGHFSRIPGIRANSILADARSNQKA